MERRIALTPLHTADVVSVHAGFPRELFLSQSSLFTERAEDWADRRWICRWARHPSVLRVSRVAVYPL